MYAVKLQFFHRTNESIMENHNFCKKSSKVCQSRPKSSKVVQSHPKSTKVIKRHQHFHIFKCFLDLSLFSPNKFICRGSHGLGKGEGLVCQRCQGAFFAKLPASLNGAWEEPGRWFRQSLSSLKKRLEIGLRASYRQMKTTIRNYSTRFD